MNWQWFEALEKSPRTSPGIRAVGLVLAIRAKRSDPTCNPSIRSISKSASVGHTTACKAIKYFEELGMLRVEPGRGIKANIYHLTVPASGTLSVPETGTQEPDPERSSQWNTEGASVPASGALVFPRANPEREKPSKGSLVQDDDVSADMPESGVPY